MERGPRGTPRLEADLETGYAVDADAEVEGGARRGGCETAVSRAMDAASDGSARGRLVAADAASVDSTHGPKARVQWQSTQ